MNKGDWKVILASLKQGSCVALVGPNLPTTAVTGEPQNLAAMLSRRLGAELSEDDAEGKIEVHDPDDFPLVAQSYSDAYSRETLRVEVESFFGEIREKLRGNGHDAVFESLAALPISLFVSTRHDQVLEHYLQACGKSPVIESYDFRGNQQRTIGGLGSVDKPLVYRMLGQLDKSERLALTETDLLDLLESIISGNPGLPNDLRAAFHDKSFLFLGCGLRTYYIRVFLHALGLSKSAKPSFSPGAIPAVQETEEFRKSVWFYTVGYKGLRLLDIEEQEFVRELRRLWEENHPAGMVQHPTAIEEVEDVTEGPEVFISYMSEDAEYAEQAAEALRRNGIRIWLDKDKLRGGDRWDAVLEDAIASVDFFIVLLSKNLTEGAETYVHKEIGKALERKSMKSAVIKFIFPMRIDEEAPLLDAIERARIQAGSLVNLDSDAAGLASDIRRQFAKLQRR